VAAAAVDRLVRYAEVIALKGDSYRIKVQTSAASPPSRPTTNEIKLVSFRLLTTESIFANASSHLV
jgi:hypothetical protein